MCVYGHGYYGILLEVKGAKKKLKQKQKQPPAEPLASAPVPSPAPATIHLDSAEIMTRAEVAVFLKYNKKTLANLAAKREGPPCYTNGNKTWYIKAEVMAWLRSLPRRGQEPI